MQVGKRLYLQHASKICTKIEPSELLIDLEKQMREKMVQKEQTELSFKEYYRNTVWSSKNLPSEFRKKIAKACGVTENAVYRWLNGAVVPGKLQQEKIAELLEIPAEVLFPNSED